MPRAEIVPASVTVTDPAPPLGPPLEITPPPDAKAFRERGIFAYRSGDLDNAIADFDRAIRLDPKFAAAYIDRGIVLYRMRRFEQAFADIAQAKRIERTRTAKGGNKQRTTSPAIEMSVMPPPLPRARHTARLDSPREVGFLKPAAATAAVLDASAKSSSCTRRPPCDAARAVVSSPNACCLMGLRGR